MKGKIISFRPSIEHRARLDRLVKATGHTASFFITKALEAHLSELEKRYAKDLEELGEVEAKNKRNGLLQGEVKP